MKKYLYSVFCIPRVVLTVFNKNNSENVWRIAEKFVPLQCRNKDGNKAPRSARKIFQVHQNLRPAQRAKIPSGKRHGELINHKLQIYDFLLQNVRVLTQTKFINFRS